MSNYRIWIKTSDLEHAGTDAHVYLTVHGATGSSPEMFLDDPKIDNWEPGTLDQFNVNFRDVGEISSIRIRHDNTGKRPGWHPEFIDIQRGEDPNAYWRVDINQWLATSTGDKRIDRTLQAVRCAPIYTSNDGRHSEPSTNPTYIWAIADLYVRGTPPQLTERNINIQDGKTGIKIECADGAMTVLIQRAGWHQKFGPGDADLPGDGQYVACMGDWDAGGGSPPHARVWYTKRTQS